MGITFLHLDEILHIHEDQVQRYGGDGGIRDTAALLSAVAMPQATYDQTHLHHDLFEMAAAYLFHIVQNHPFVDGNKRTGTVAAIVFLGMNDVEIDVDPDELADCVFAVARGEIDKLAVATFLRRHAVA